MTRQGKPILDGDGQPLHRCSYCGLPRGTVAHATHCMAKLCTDPDADTFAELKSLRAKVQRVREECENTTYLYCDNADVLFPHQILDILDGDKVKL